MVAVAIGTMSNDATTDVMNMIPTMNDWNGLGMLKKIITRKLVDSIKVVMVTMMAYIEKQLLKQFTANQGNMQTFMNMMMSLSLIAFPLP